MRSSDSRTPAGTKPVGKLTIHIHTLRKSCGQNWADDLPMNVVKELMGHSSIATTQEFYTQVNSDHEAKAANILQRLIEDSGANEKLTLPTMAEPIQLTREVEAEVEAQRRTADQRTRFEQAIFRVQNYATEQKIKAPECFISYAWGVKEHERWVEKSLAKDLQKAGIHVILDRWETARVGASVSRFVQRIGKASHVLVVGTPSYLEKCNSRNPAQGYAVAAEFDILPNRMLGTEAQKESVLPVLLAGEKTMSFPPLLHDRVRADFRKEEDYFVTAFELILSLYGIAPSDPAVADLRESLREPRMR